MWSRYLRIRERNGVVAIFHELHPDPIYYTLNQWNDLDIISDNNRSILDELQNKKLIINNPEDDKKEFNKTASALELKLNQSTILYLMTTQECNLKCKYCPVHETEEKQGLSMLTTEDCIAGIQLWQEHIKDAYDPNLQYFIIFYGGEPLLNKKVIRCSLTHIQIKKKSGQLPKNINIMIATNGILIDKDIINLCDDYNVMVTVGLDGPRNINDLLRIDSNGNGTFNQAVSAIKLLIKNNIRTFASVSITPFNIDYISEYSTFFKELGVEKFGFNFLKGRKLQDLVGINGLDSYFRNAARGIIKNAQNQSLPNFEYQMEKKQTAFDNQDFYPVDCTCYGNQLVIQPNGQISNCPFFNAKLGHVRNINKSFRIWNQPIVSYWRKRLPLYHKGEAKAISGGGCAWSSFELKGDTLANDDADQIFSEEVLNELVWSKYKRISYKVS